MADYTNSKGLPPDHDGNPGKVYLENETLSPFGRLETILTAQNVRDRFLFGLPLQSRIIDPVTKVPQKLTDSMIQEYIRIGINQAEAELGLVIMPTKFAEKQAFDKTLYNAFGMLRINHRPIYSLDRLSIKPANNSEILTLPLEWVETVNMAHGIINLVPLQLTSYGVSAVTGSSLGGSSSSYFLNVFSHLPFIPAYWQVEYTAGFKDGLVPAIVNEFIGLVVSLRILSMLAATYALQTSASLSLDGMAQAISTPGPNLFTVRISEIEKEKEMLKGKLKSMFGAKWMVGEL